VNIKHIAVVSTNPTFVRFFELECRLLGGTVQHFSKMPSALEKYTYIFVDIDTVRHYPLDRESVITVSKAVPSKGPSRHLLWPIALEEIREIFEQSPLSPSNESIHTEEDTAVWIQSRDRRELRCGTRHVMLSQSEFMLFETLVSAQKKPVSREVLMGLFATEGGNIVDVYVCLLRKKLEQLCDRRTILTVRGVGYRLLLDVKETEIKQ